jgi:hypothetical protein
MVNIDMVTARPSPVSQPHFCEFFLAFARFLHSKNPVKYKTIFEINQDTRRVLAPAPAAELKRTSAHQCDTAHFPRLTLVQYNSAKLLQARKAPPSHLAKRQTGGQEG